MRNQKDEILERIRDFHQPYSLLYWSLKQNVNCFVNLLLSQSG